MKEAKEKNVEGLRRKKHKIFGRPVASENEKRNIKYSVFLNIEEDAELKNKISETSLTMPEFFRRAALSRHIREKYSVTDTNCLHELRTLAQTCKVINRHLLVARIQNKQINYGKLEAILEETVGILREIRQKINE
jgi:hypothetical protein